MTNSYDLNDLSTKEVQNLINELKNPTKLIAFNKMYLEIFNSFSTKLNDNLHKDQSIIDVGDDILYILHFHKSRYEERFSIHLRFKENNFHLVRIDIGSGHKNPDGTRLNEDHIHFYVNPNNHQTDWAIPLRKSNFPNVKNFVDAFKKFLIYTNIKHIK